MHEFERHVSMKGLRSHVPGNPTGIQILEILQYAPLMLYKEKCINFRGLMRVERGRVEVH